MKTEHKSQELLSLQKENLHLQQSIAVLRDELEKTCYDKDCIVSQQIADSSDNDNPEHPHCFQRRRCGKYKRRRDIRHVQRHGGGSCPDRFTAKLVIRQALLAISHKEGALPNAPSLFDVI